MEAWQTSNVRQLRLGEEIIKTERRRRHHRMKINEASVNCNRPDGNILHIKTTVPISVRYRRFVGFERPPAPFLPHPTPLLPISVQSSVIMLFWFLSEYITAV